MVLRAIKYLGNITQAHTFFSLKLPSSMSMTADSKDTTTKTEGQGVVKENTFFKEAEICETYVRQISARPDDTKCSDINDEERSHICSKLCDIVSILPVLLLAFNVLYQKFSLQIIDFCTLGHILYSSICIKSKPNSWIPILSRFYTL